MYELTNMIFMFLRSTMLNQEFLAAGQKVLPKIFWGRIHRYIGGSGVPYYVQINNLKLICQYPWSNFQTASKVNFYSKFYQEKYDLFQFEPRNRPKNRLQKNILFFNSSSSFRLNQLTRLHCFEHKKIEYQHWHNSNIH